MITTDIPIYQNYVSMSDLNSLSFAISLIDPFHPVIYATVRILGFHDMFTKILEISWEWPPQPHAFSMGVRWQLPAPALHAHRVSSLKIIHLYEVDRNARMRFNLSMWNAVRSKSNNNSSFYYIGNFFRKRILKSLKIEDW